MQFVLGAAVFATGVLFGAALVVSALNKRTEDKENN